MSDDLDGEDQGSLDLPLEQEEGDLSIPPIIPPRTKSPVTFNQQVNIQQIPPQAWDKLSDEQIVELSKAALTQFDKTDDRHYQVALDRADKESKSEPRAQVIGGVLALVGVLSVTYLSAAGETLVSAILATFLATIIAVVVGGKLID